MLYKYTKNYYFANNVVRRQQLMSTTHPDHSDYIKKFIVCTERSSNQILVTKDESDSLDKFIDYFMLFKYKH